MNIPLPRNLDRLSQSARIRNANLVQLHREFMTEQRFAARLSPVTLRGYGQSFALLVSLMPAITIRQLSPASMTEFFRRLDTRSRPAEGGGGKSGVLASTVATYRTKLNKFF